MLSFWKAKLSAIACSLLLVAATIGTSLPADAGCCKEKGTTAGATVSFPVLFATDRAQIIGSKKDLDYGKQIIFPLDSITYGVKRVQSTYSAHEEGDLDSLPKRGWIVYPLELNKKERADYLKHQKTAELSHALAGFAEFATKLKAMLDVAPKREIVVYVHGCCVDFEGSMQQCADLASSVKVPVIAYAWGCSKGYGGSTVSFPRTQERFNRFMCQLLTTFPKERVSIVSNSIGTQLVHNFCLQRRPEDYGYRTIDELIFSRADLDDIAFKSQLDSLTRHSKKIIVYVAKNDFQINVSGTLRWFFYPSQHGERAGHLRSGLQNEPSLTVLDVSPLKMGHVIPYNSVADLLENDGQVPKETRLYQYEQMEDNLYRVKRKMPGKIKHATAPGSPLK